MFMLFNFLVYITLQYFFRKNETIQFVLLGLYQLAVALPSIAVGVRRLHDINCRGYWILLNLFPGIGQIAYIILCALSGTQGPNRFGPEPTD